MSNSETRGGIPQIFVVCMSYSAPTIPYTPLCAYLLFKFGMSRCLSSWPPDRATAGESFDICHGLSGRSMCDCLTCGAEGRDAGGKGKG